MTYQQAYDKIIQAYFRDEIQPYDAKFCFCGTLCDNSIAWARCSYASVKRRDPHNDFANYTGVDYMEMERALILEVQKSGDREDNLFLGMTAALEVLKQIHRERGEDVDSMPALTKRNLKPTVQ